MNDSLIPHIAFGNQGPYLHFAHANAYPPGSYRQLLTYLSEEYRVLATSFRPLWPGSDPKDIDSWDDMAIDQIQALDQLVNRPVIGVGHSLGAVTTMMAAKERPDLFEALILIEPVFLDRQYLIDLQKRGLTDPNELPFIKVAKKRRNSWLSRQEAFDHFREKPVFADMSDEVLRDFVTAGVTSNDDGGYQLAFAPIWEAWIYAHLPTQVWDLIPQVIHPTLALRGQKSDTFTHNAWRDLLATQPEAVAYEIPDAGHLLPLEKPAEVSRLIFEFLKSVA